jgi:hypothetical protein
VAKRIVLNKEDGETYEEEYLKKELDDELVKEKEDSIITSNAR